MFFYFSVILITTVLAYLFEKVKKRQKSLMFSLLVVFPSMISGFRGVGTDYRMYLNNYSTIVQGAYEFVDYKSIIVRILQFLGTYGFYFQISVFLVSIVTVYVAFTIFREYEKDISFTFAVFSYMIIFYQMSMNIFRQLLAAKIFLLATVSLFKKDNVTKYWVWYITAILIHSSIVPFGLIFFFKKSITCKEYRIRRIILYIVVLAAIFLLPSLAHFVEKLSGVLSHYAWYLTRFEYTGIGFGFIRYLVLAIFPTVYIVSRGLEAEMKIKRLSFLGFYSMMGAILWMTSYVSVSTIYRLSYNLLVALPVMHGALYKKYCLKERFVVSGAMFIIMVLFWYYDGMILNSGETVPYLFFWQR